MISAYPRVKLGDVTINYDARRVPVREADRRPGPYPYYGASGIVDHVDGYLFDGQYLLIAEDGENLRTRQTPVAFLAKGRFWVNNHAHIVTGSERADTRYLCYALAATDIGGYLTGSAMPKLSQRAMNAIEIPLPTLIEQRAIAEVLGGLDDKIEQNRQTSASLERLARALFGAWFVDFEPVKAKAAGATAFPSIPAEVFDVLPRRLVDSDLGPVPEGWKPATLAAIMTESTARNAGEDVSLVLSAVSSGELVASDEHFTKRVYSKSIANYKLVQPGWIAFNPSRINIGSIGINHRAVAGAVSPVYVVCSLQNEFEWYFELFLRLPRTIERFQTLSSGSVRQSLRAVDFLSIEVVLPQARVLEAFNEVYLSLRAKIDANGAESSKLTELRDYLLPKLLSGTVRVGVSDG